MIANRDSVRDSNQNPSRRFLRAILSAYFLFCMLFSTTSRAQQAGESPLEFRVHLLNPESEFSAATAFDVNEDGLVDIVSGAFWYEAPQFAKHQFRDVTQIRGRYDDYSNLATDVDADGDTDIVSVNYRSRSLYWCENPGPENAGQLWTSHVIDTPGSSETGRLVDIDGDGQLDILPNGTDFAAWYGHHLSDDGSVSWTRFDLPSELAGHGIGAGDIDGDGRVDVVGPRGWAKAPEDPRTGRWLWKPEFQLAADCGLPILCHDVDADGDTDLIWARGHNIGLYWTEQVASDDVYIRDPNRLLPDGLTAMLNQPKWITHAIDTRYSSFHTLMLADLDNDGRDEIVAGKRFMGHDGKDPGENDPLCIVYYKFDPATKTFHNQGISYGGRCGIDLDSVCADLDGDGDQDILAPARSGLHWIENLGPQTRAAAEFDAAALIDTYDHRDVLTVVDQAGTQRPLASPTDHGRRRNHILDGMQQVMGPLPSTNRRCPLRPTIQTVDEMDKYWRLGLTFQADAAGEQNSVPAFLLVPKGLSRRTAALLCLHPTHPLGKAQICGLGGKPSRFYAHELAEMGFICLAPDYPSFGNNSNYDFTSAPYNSGTMKAIWDNIRAVDLLESLPCVDRDRIGAIGHSLGGHNALFTAAFDQRLRCAVTSCGFTAFHDYYEGDLTGWTSQRYMPAIRQRYSLDPDQVPFDFHEVLAAIAPRPVFVSAPQKDSNFEVKGVQRIETLVSPLYRLLGAEENAHFVYPDAEHDFPVAVRQAAYEWIAATLE